MIKDTKWIMKILYQQTDSYEEVQLSFLIFIDIWNNYAIVCFNGQWKLTVYYRYK